VERGPLEVIHLASGVTVVEMPAGQRKVNLALAPGRYLVRRHADGRTATKEVQVVAGKSSTLLEGQLEATAHERLAVKGEEVAPLSAASSLGRGWWEVRLAAGVSTGPGRSFGSQLYGGGPGSSSDAALARSFASGGFIGYGITDRLTWALPLPAFSYRFGRPRGLEVVVRGGLTGLGYSDLSGWVGNPDVGGALRIPTTPTQGLILTATADSAFGTNGSVDLQPGRAPTVWRVQAGPAYTVDIRGAVTLGFGANVTGALRFGRPPTTRMPWYLMFGSVHGLGYREVPLVSVHLTQRFALDAYASWAVDTSSGDVHDRYLAGFTWIIP
jgi:hypothetical protein